MYFLFSFICFGIFFQLISTATVPHVSVWCPNCNSALPPQIVQQNFVNLQEQTFAGKSKCGDKVCNPLIGETCLTCPGDCGTCSYPVEIKSCVHKGHITLTFDDGPSSYFSKLLDKLKALHIKASFFINGFHIMENVSASSVVGKTSGWTQSSFAQLIQRAHNEGHVIGSHTYSHIGMTSGMTSSATGENVVSSLKYVTHDMFRMQLYFNDITIYDILGKYPVAFRPPYLELNSTVITLLDTMGYIPISIDVDSKDYTSSSTSEVMDTFMNDVHANMANEGLIALMHDGYQVTLDSLDQLVSKLNEQGITIVDLPTCLNMPLEHFYRTSMFNKAINANNGTTVTNTTTTTTTSKTTTSTSSSSSKTTSTTSGSKIAAATDVGSASSSSYLVTGWINYILEIIGLGLATLGLF